MKKLPILKTGDFVEIIAPASRFSESRLQGLKTLLKSWKLNYIIPEDILGNDLLCANCDDVRFKNLKNALQNPKIKAIVCASGGYGSIRLIPELAKVTPLENPKIFIGMSDTIPLQLYLQQQWQWPTIHGSAAPDKFSPESLAFLKSILFGELTEFQFSGLPLNKFAATNSVIDTSIIGGNMSMIQAGLGTKWQIDGRDKVILLKEISERGYRIDRMLEHFCQANIFKDASAILLGDFIGGNEPNGTSLIKPVLQRFAERCEIPVIHIEGIGHTSKNFPIPLGTPAKLQFGDKIKLVCTR